MTLIVHRDILAFVVGFVVAWVLLRGGGAGNGRTTQTSSPQPQTGRKHPGGITQMSHRFAQGA